jgi:uncharacterized caspase-like protein
MFSPDGTLIVAIDEAGIILCWETETRKEIWQYRPRLEWISSVAMSNNSEKILVSDESGSMCLLSLRTGEILTAAFPSPRIGGRTASVNFTQGDRLILQARQYGLILVFDAQTGRMARAIDPGEGVKDISERSFITAAAVSPSGQRLVCGLDDGTVESWDLNAGKVSRRYKAQEHAISAVAFIGSGNIAVIGSYDGRTLVWDSDSGTELCQLISFENSPWIVIAPEGRFDTSNLEEVKGLHWVAPDDPMRPLPLEIFMRDYYEPRLLPRLLNGERFSQTRKLTELNRVQPGVMITAIERQKGSHDSVTVTVEVAKTKSVRQKDKRGTQRETGVYDLRLFRDGQIVGQYADGKPQALQQSANDKETLLAWRSENEVRLDSNGKRIIKFDNIKLPRRADLKQVEFTAYAFNEDRVKSQTDRKTFDIPAGLAPKKGRAYIVTVGVNAHENPSFNLKYSVNDARLIEKTVTEKLAKSAEYEEVMPVSLLSESGKQPLATKRHVRAVLDILAGRAVDGEVKKAIPNADKLHPARPEDLVLISFSSHGYADTDGSFYFVLYDTGAGAKAEVTDDLLKQALSSEELSLWLRDVDAGEMLMIVDACHSAAAVAGKEFKPGPMGSRGLGQLSYDKGMRILAATQAADVAYGIGALKQGLLTYALVKDGIEAGKADFKPVDRQITVSEWLQYGEQGVPKLLEEIGNKAKQKDAPVELKDLVQKTASELRSQRPYLFDFSRKRRDVVLVGK